MLPSTLLAAASVASLAGNVPVAEPTVTGQVIVAWPSFALIAAYELLMRQVRHDASASGTAQYSKRRLPLSQPEGSDTAVQQLPPG